MTQIEEGAPTARTINVLNLVTTDGAEFFDQQVRSLEEIGVRSDTLAVPCDPRIQATDQPRRLRAYARLLRLFRRQPLHRYDLVHANYGLMAPIALSQRRLPVVLSLWGSDLYGRYGPLTRICSRFCDAVIVMTEEMETRLGCESTVIPHGVDLNVFRPIPQRAAQQQIGWAPDHKHVFFPYPIDRTVKDFARTKQIVENVRELIDKEVVLQVGNGSIPHSEMSCYLSAADALLLTSKREGSPNIIKEAMACNLPVISTDVGDVARRLHGIRSSYVCESDHDLTTSLATVLKQNTRSNGRTAIGEMSTRRMAEQIVAVYEQVLDRSSIEADPVNH